MTWTVYLMDDRRRRGAAVPGTKATAYAKQVTYAATHGKASCCSGMCRASNFTEVIVISSLSVKGFEFAMLMLPMIVCQQSHAT